MRRKILVLAFSVFCFALGACGEKSVSETKPMDVSVPPPPLPAVSPVLPKDGNYDGKGTITKINLELGSVELDHEEIKDLMPAMQMEFFVQNKEILKGFEVGDRVDFVVEYKHPQEIVTSIKKAK